MATKRMIARDKKLLKMQRDLTTRRQLKHIIKKSKDPGQVLKACWALQDRPVDESPTRYVRRCQVCYRPKGVYRLVGLCRCCLRKFVMLGLVPGMTKSSW
jgi:small subunit ribosomal protein S14